MTEELTTTVEKLTAATTASKLSWSERDPSQANLEDYIAIAPGFRFDVTGGDTLVVSSDGKIIETVTADVDDLVVAIQVQLEAALDAKKAALDVLFSS